MTSASAVTVFHRNDDDRTGFEVWAAELLASARSAAGHLSGYVSDLDDPHMDWAVAVTFADEDQLHSWLDSPARRDMLRDGQTRGFWCGSGDLVLTDAGPTSAGVGVFRHAVTAGKEGEFRRMQARLSTAAVAFPGYEGTVLIPADREGEWLSIIRFRTGPHLSAWMRSAERTEALAGLRSTLSEDFATISNTTPFGTTVRIEDGRTLMTPNWKSVMLVLLVLYPTVMLLSRFLGPVVDEAGAAPWLGLWISQVVSVSAMQWWLMPAVSRPFRTWLDPVDGAGVRTSLAGAGVILALYAVTFTVFATVHDLQFWDYAN
ncbi:antibiotic biosynthesis monooxygenase [Mycolicibacterium aurum]|uniref:Antibiotic biosynthesis monooxygenase n=1 Tax=Mycolicibacterium aurum TaxID=1791 RepID=A0A3S4RIL7_MYCAU|nr:antibiotic biosynthesis monooxygenase [Mycolicibacterium aurum]VEG51367.1 antibiotic biosynthesis monooxygenase [Mycolicibacterium aurum]